MKGGDDPNPVLNLTADLTEIRERGPIARWAGFLLDEYRCAKFQPPRNPRIAA
jgi:hypothetical protein